MTREEMEMQKLVRESDVIDKTNGTELARAFNTLWNKYIEKETSEDCIARQPLIDNWNSCADMLMNEGDAEVVMGWIFDAPSVTPTQEPNLDKIRKEIMDWQTDIHDNEYDAESYDFVFEVIYDIIDKYRAKSEDK